MKEAADLAVRVLRDRDHRAVRVQLVHRHREAALWLAAAPLLRYRLELGLQRQLGFFLHIPFPPLDVLMKLPWRFEILQALLEYDLVGFQTARDLRNFIGCVRALIPDARTTTKRMAATVSYRERQARLQSWYAELQKNTDVIIFDPRLKSAGQGGSGCACCNG